MVAPLFDPSSIEWIALILFLFVSFIPVFSLNLMAITSNWKIWYSGNRFYKPSFMLPPIFYVSLNGIFHIILGSAIFLIWREGQRSEPLFSPPIPTSGVPNINLYFSAMLIYLINIGIGTCFGPIFFEFQAFGVGLAIIFINFLLEITLLVIFSIIWWLPALLISFLVAWRIYTCFICASIWRNSKLGADGVYVGYHLATLIQVFNNAKNKKKNDQFNSQNNTTSNSKKPNSAPYGSSSHIKNHNHNNNYDYDYNNSNNNNNDNRNYNNSPSYEDQRGSAKYGINRSNSQYEYGNNA